MEVVEGRVEGAAAIEERVQLCWAHDVPDGYGRLASWQWETRKHQQHHQLWLIRASCAEREFYNTERSLLGRRRHIYFQSKHCPREEAQHHVYLQLAGELQGPALLTLV